MDKLNSYSGENLNIILLTSTDIVVEETENIKFAKDEKNKLLKKFSKNKTSPYSVFLDFNDKVLISKNGMIDDTEYFEIINYTLLGLIVGNEVGNICINKDINLIGSNETFSVAKNRGKITVINFWFTTCTPCVHELPFFDKVYKEYSDEISVIAIHEANGYQNNPDNVRNFVETQFEGFSIMFGYDDPNNPYYTLLGGLKAWPVTVIVDSDGIISKVNHGDMTEEQLRFEIEKLIK